MRNEKGKSKKGKEIITRKGILATRMINRLCPFFRSELAYWLRAAWNSYLQVEVLTTCLDSGVTTAPSPQQSDEFCPCGKKSIVQFRLWTKWFQISMYRDDKHPRPKPILVSREVELGCGFRMDALLHGMAYASRHPWDPCFFSRGHRLGSDATMCIVIPGSDSPHSMSRAGSSHANSLSCVMRKDRLWIYLHQAMP